MTAIDIFKLALVIWSWCVIGVLLFFLGRIARFYEKTAGQRVGYSLLLPPVLLLGMGVGWYLVHDVDFVGQYIGDMFLIAGGILLLLFSVHLQEVMTGERR